MRPGIGDRDAIITAIAAIVDKPVHTRNVSEFERVDGFEVERY